MVNVLTLTNPPYCPIVYGAGVLIFQYFGIRGYPCRVALLFTVTKSGLLVYIQNARLVLSFLYDSVPEST